MKRPWRGGVSSIGVGVLWLLGGVAGVAGCSTPLASTPSVRGSFAVTPESVVNQGGSPDLLRRLASSPYRYFRFLSRPFAIRVCEAFEDMAWGMPVVVLHGDAHLEQFVVTAQTHGLEDFDQAGLGPAVVDLARFATSLHLACEQASWACQPEQAIDALLAGYRRGFAGDDKPPPPPRIVGRLREARAQRDAADFLGWAQSLMVPLTPKEEASLLRSWDRFVTYLVSIEPDHDRSFFQLVAAGRLKMGIGSALDDKFLFRVQGSSADPDDDWVLEIKQQAPPMGVACLSTLQGGGMFRPLFAAALLGRRLPAVLAYVPVKGDAGSRRQFWAQTWDPGYTELSVEEVANQTELDELGLDAGFQLGRGQVNAVPERIRPQHRYVSRGVLERSQERIYRLSRQWAAEVVEAWQVFRDAVSSL